jgi:hypothetical protein
MAQIAMEKHFKKKKSKQLQSKLNKTKLVQAVEAP